MRSASNTHIPRMSCRDTTNPGRSCVSGSGSSPGVLKRTLRIWQGTIEICSMLLRLYEGKLLVGGMSCCISVSGGMRGTGRWCDLSHKEPWRRSSGAVCSRLPIQGRVSGRQEVRYTDTSI